MGFVYDWTADRPLEEGGGQEQQCQQEAVASTRLAATAASASGTSEDSAVTTKKKGGRGMGRSRSAAVLKPVSAPQEPPLREDDIAGDSENVDPGVNVAPPVASGKGVVKEKKNAGPMGKRL